MTYLLHLFAKPCNGGNGKSSYQYWLHCIVQKSPCQYELRTKDLFIPVILSSHKTLRRMMMLPVEAIHLYEGMNTHSWRSSCTKSCGSIYLGYIFQISSAQVLFQCPFFWPRNPGNANRTSQGIMLPKIYGLGMWFGQ